MTRKILAVSLSVMMCGLLAFAQEAAKTVTIKGQLIDNMCAGAPGEDKDYEAEAREHKLGCVMMPHCAKSGFAVASGRKLYKLDEAGNKLVADVLKATKATKDQKGLTVEVEGTVEGTTLHATKIKEVASE